MVMAMEGMTAAAMAMAAIEGGTVTVMERVTATQRWQWLAQRRRQWKAWRQQDGNNGNKTAATASSE